MQHPLTVVLSKIFVNGFYRAHAGLFIFAFLVIFGSVDPGQLLGYHRALMLAFVSDPVMLSLVFAGWLLYALKTFHYVASQLNGSSQQFLFYSSNSFGKPEQLKSWCAVQLAIMLPVSVYGLLAAAMGLYHHLYVLPVVVICYLLLLVTGCAWLYVRLVNRLSDRSQLSVLTRFSQQWRKPFFSLYGYQVMHQAKVAYLLVKLLSWGIITAVFALFADVSSDSRVACIALLAIAAAHAVLVFNQHVFERERMQFSRNLPYTRLSLFGGYLLGYLVLVIPEAIWIFSRFNLVMAAGLLVFALGTIMLLHCLLYWLGPDMDRYMQWVGGLFVVLFLVILFRWTVALCPGSFAAAYLLFYRNYYRSHELQAETPAAG
ncbi:hypothetical protein [Hufsiella ginkgonis]|uniref:Uncharacterized protein n=1 Tax=Hufsiella ginkgonis TaxID=2695274 RepID=A0A7K1XSG0_9SPHI|nr:hypothetical protein [Hufsiella ginkgonis]MXV13807.1 hypothetical protein [Hufsiella ginkgonis]